MKTLKAKMVLGIVLLVTVRVVVMKVVAVTTEWRQC